MATLNISNFITIKQASIKLSRINIFIGPQAKGKSLISKLIYFFKEFPDAIFDGALEDRNKRQFDASCKAKFESIFPPYAWEKKQFLVVYDSGAHKIYVENIQVGSKFRFSITYTDSINKALSVGRRIYSKSSSSEGDLGITTRQRPNLIKEVREAIAAALYKYETNPKVEQMFYIPAGRSFFSNLQKNLFSFISSNTPIDYFLKEFGAIYERTRDFPVNRTISRLRPKPVQKLMEDLICGTYVYEKGQDWIMGDHGRVSLSNSSSGQQEVLPMAMVLSTWPYMGSNFFNRSFIIEEPEAHLFPIAQSQVVSLIASAYNSPEGCGDFVITTHSPYILTALNNFIQADNAVRALEGSDASAVYELVPEDQHVKFEDVSAYIVDRGTVKSITDPDYRLIQSEAIDSVSDFFSSRFEQLLELEMGAADDEGQDQVDKELP